MKKYHQLTLFIPKLPQMRVACMKRNCSIKENNHSPQKSIIFHSRSVHVVTTRNETKHNKKNLQKYLEQISSILLTSHTYMSLWSLSQNFEFDCSLLKLEFSFLFAYNFSTVCFGFLFSLALPDMNLILRECKEEKIGDFVDFRLN